MEPKTNMGKKYFKYISHSLAFVAKMKVKIKSPANAATVPMRVNQNALSFVRKPATIKT